MKLAKLYRTLIAVFFIGILSSTFVVQGSGFKKKFSSRTAGYSLVVKSQPDAPCKNQKQAPVGLGMMSEEEEEIHVKTEFIHAPESKSFIVLRSISFASPTLFFKEHSREVTSPPPWS